MLEIITRKAKMSDIPEVMKLLKTTDFIDQETSYNNPQYFERSVQDGIFFVAEVDHKILGMIMGELLICDGSVIWYFVVQEDMRGQGIGKKLLAAFESDSKAKGAKWIFGSGDIKWETMNFYKRNGVEFGKTYVEFMKDI
ncbi:MAG: GNAT family N-acetyltransferase [Lactobacillales bacterium]|jgi:N-acetylglutamate synthase-like GNAT family acetyltransferase|nr:GNAT family N-acetyltransferase [Lactobacillales bacterium]